MINDNQSTGWKFIEGEWKCLEESLYQCNEEMVTRCYRCSGLQDFVVDFQLLLTATENTGGEAKFIYNGADSNEDYRIDFLYMLNGCRITTGRWAGISPLELLSGKEYRVRVRVRDHIIRVEVDDMVIVPGFNFGKRSDGNIGFGTWQAAVSFEKIRINPFRQKKCFVVMPFDQKRNLLYEDAIKPALETHPDFVFDFHRADESLTVGKITEEIGKSIDDADVLIADISVINANVYYELGYGHARRKKALLLAEESPETNVPFDIKDFRHHRYDFTRRGLDDLSQKIQEILSNILTDDEG
jgi:hypothetical protein